MDSGRKFEGTDAAVTLVIEYHDSAELVEDLTANLEDGGTFVQTERTFAPGTAVDLVLRFPGLLQPIQLMGEVVEMPEQDAGVAIAFVGYDDLAKARLLSVIEAIGRRDPRFVGEVVRVLVVDDNPHIVKLISDGLRLRGRRAFKERLAFDFSVATNGRDALSQLTTRPFDIVITDIYLPMVDGLQLMREIRSSDTSHLRVIPILAMSAGDPSTRDLALGAGADLFMPKPVKLRELLSEMARALELARDREESRSNAT
jgi:CheY-like chemotaxis protein/Tfp pilus assembly protein PilZ